MKSGRLLILLFLVQSGWAEAEIYKHVDAQGNVTYSNAPIKGGKKLNLEPLPTMAPYSGVPNIDSDTQRRRDKARRQILEDERSSEERKLTQARQELQNAQENPEVRRGPAGNVMVDNEKQDERIRVLQDQVSSHERNLDMIRNELSRLK